MSRRNPQPQQQVDASGDCRHLYLTRDATCVHCGMQFRLAWACERRELVKPTTRNLIFAIIGVILLVPAQAFPIGGSSILASVFLVIAVLFFTADAVGRFRAVRATRVRSRQVGAHRQAAYAQPIAAQAVRHDAGARSFSHRPRYVQVVRGGRHAPDRAPALVASARGDLQGPPCQIGCAVHS